MLRGSQLGSPVPLGQVLLDQAVADNPEDEEEGLYLPVILTYFGLFGREDLTELTHTTSSKVFSSSDLVYQSVS
ncbi:hypothetical protein RUM44_000192 [Polyplax serrata]|uniref:Uncharacterized protein n=1 Tax=Polyplax serrata TaxID=468196 RepID=A0ABR1B4R2_POLSC